MERQVTNTITWNQYSYINQLTNDRDWSKISTAVRDLINQITSWKFTDAFELANAKNTLVEIKDANIVIKALLCCRPTPAAIAAYNAKKMHVSTPVVAPAPVIKAITWADVNAALLDVIPCKYAILKADDSGEYVFYEVRKTPNKKMSIYRLQGAPGDWHRINMTPAAALNVIARIKVDAKAAAKKYGELYTTCAKCDSPLSNAKSIEQQMGPVCIKYFN